MDIKLVSGTAFTTTAAVATWVEPVNAYGQLVVTVLGILVGIATLCYTLRKLAELHTDLEYKSQKRKRRANKWYIRKPK